MSKRAEKFAEKIHNTALLEAKKYATEHGGSFMEEVCYGRGFKTGSIVGYEQAEKEYMEKAEKWLKENLNKPFENGGYITYTPVKGLKEPIDVYCAFSRFINDFKHFME